MFNCCPSCKEGDFNAFEKGCDLNQASLAGTFSCLTSVVGQELQKPTLNGWDRPDEKFKVVLPAAFE